MELDSSTGSPLSPTLFCSPFDACSSHGFSSLQSPSAFPSYSSDGFSEQIESSSLGAAERFPSLLRHWGLGASFDVEEATSESPDELASQGLLSQAILASEDFIQDGSLLEDSVIASNQQHHTKTSALLSMQTNSPAIAGDSHSCLFVSSPVLVQQSSLLQTPHTDDTHEENGNVSRPQVTKDCECQACERHASIVTITNEIQSEDCFASSAQETEDCECHVYERHAPDVTIMKGHDRAQKDQFRDAHQNKSRAQKIQARASMATPFSALSRIESAKETMREPLQEVRECKRVMLPASKEDISSPMSPSTAMKENLEPQSFKQGPVKGGSYKVNPGEWLCPRDAKKTFKPKPRQVLLNKWLSRQR